MQISCSLSLSPSGMLLYLVDNLAAHSFPSSLSLRRISCNDKRIKIAQISFRFLRNQEQVIIAIIFPNKLFLLRNQGMPC
jgi:hypothetical protein